MRGPLEQRIGDIPPALDRWAVDLARIRLREANDSGSAAAAALADLTGGETATSRLLDAVLGGSPFLADLVIRDPAFALACLKCAPEDVFDDIVADVAVIAGSEESERAVKKGLRKSRSRAALVVALADLAAAWDIMTVCQALTRFADTTLVAGVNWLMAEAQRAGRFVINNPGDAGTGSGYVVLAMGKQGAFELNYSSDIDLIVLYDPETAPLAPSQEPSSFFVRLTRRLVGLLQDVTEDGYVFRVDLRLRPDPRATQIAIAYEAAANYYEHMGQNWERAAMIKARPVAGDIALGEEFLERLVPYKWRKYLDFAAIADVQSLKRQIHAVKGHGTIAVRGHNVKLGRGGIREIEFFVQTQQLIAGGRSPLLRGRATLAMLDALAEAKWIASQAAHELKQAYRFLRSVEHRIQMTADQQSHELPATDEAFACLARFCGFMTPADFEKQLRATFETVQKHYAALFEDTPDLGTDSGSLVFTGGEDDPETIDTLTRMGFRQASEVSATIRGWHFGRYASTRSARARERLTEIMPALLTALGGAGDPDQAFLAFDRFLRGLPTGVQLFSLLRANPQLLQLMATILGTAPRLAAELSQRPKVLDAVLDPVFFEAMPGADEMRSAIVTAFLGNSGLEDCIDRARIVGKELMFRIGVRVLTETVSAAEAGAAWSALADALIGELLMHVQADLEAKHGTIPGGRVAIIAMGKLGGQEMTASSDLDLIIIYDANAEAEGSDGPRPVSVNQFFTRLTQRLIAALSAPTAEGILYEVDMRLRPSGSKGPVATHIASFTAYHHESAWTWEKLALTRARVIGGDPDFVAEVSDVIAVTLKVSREDRAVRADTLDMRRRMLSEFDRKGFWDLKQVRGGLVEIEFISQMLQIIHAHNHPGILQTNTGRALAGLATEGLLAPADAEVLKRAGALYHRLTQILRLCLSKPFNPADAPDDLVRLVAQAAGVPDVASAEALLSETEASVAAIFDRLVGQV